MKSIGALLAVVSIGFQTNRKFSVSALRSPTRVQSGLLTLLVSCRSFSSTKLRSMTEAGSYQSHLKEFKIEDVSFIDSSTAKSIDDDLMFNDGSFSLDQLMELAGLSVASAVHDLYCRKLQDGSKGSDSRRILIISGPGNNGGDGLVSARHLKHFGYSPVVVYPKRSSGVIFEKLIRQCHDLGIEVLSSIPSDGAHSSTDAEKEITVESFGKYFNSFDLIVDSIFGFSFEGPPREPFRSIIAALTRTQVPLISVDIPSGWHVERGDVHLSGLLPTSVVSLTAPKLCMLGYQGVHYIGGRFVPPDLAQKYKLSLPDYGFGTNQIVVATNNQRQSEVSAAAEDAGVQGGSEGLSAVFVTASSAEEAKTLAKGLLAGGLAACVNLIPQVSSMYMWEGKLEESSEVIMMIKTRSSLLPAVTSYVKSAHSYSTPEVLALPVQGGSPEYLDWVRQSTAKGR